MHAVLRVHLERAGTDQRAQLAGGLAALQIHLEETVLPVEEPERAGGVGSGGAGDRRHAERVARDGDRRGEPAKRDVAFELRQAGPELGPHVAAAADCGDGYENDERQQNAADEAHGLIIAWLGWPTSGTRTVAHPPGRS